MKKQEIYLRKWINYMIYIVKKLPIQRFSELDPVMFECYEANKDINEKITNKITSINQLQALRKE
jgi:hypothetical protein